MNAAQKLAAAPPAATTTRRGPIAACDVYGEGDPELYAVLHARRSNNGETWADVQKILDAVLCIEKAIRPDKFRYHWSGKCGHWDGVAL